MTHTRVLLLLGGAITALAIGLAVAAPSTTQPAGEPSAAALPQSYNILLSKNIFGKPTVRTGRATPTAPAAMSALALRGVVLQDGIYTAIFEDPATHQTQTFIEGDMIGGGRISHLTLRGFALDAAGASTAVAIGQNLRGEIVAEPAPPNPTAVATAASGAAPAPSGNPPTTAPSDAIPGAAVVDGDSPVIINMQSSPAAPNESRKWINHR